MGWGWGIGATIACKTPVIISALAKPLSCLAGRTIELISVFYLTLWICQELNVTNLQPIP
jgi:hypothetical protein